MLLLLLALPLVATADSSPVAVAPDVTLVPGSAEPGRQPDGNSVVIATKDGHVVVDTGRRASHARKLVDLAREDGRAIVAVVNTHWHLDHVSGNPIVREAFPDARVYATDAIEGAMSGFLAGYRAQLEAALAKTPESASGEAWREEIARIDAGRALYPDEVLGVGRAQRIGGRIDVHVAADATTAADAWVFDRDSRVLVAGDLVTLPAPFFDTACPAGWRRALDTLARQPFAVLVPGHGAPNALR
jgi:glyoxylase-like metal-dependent hydrolase (beta-lactamase superfamily II)